ncbi:WG repeat-containing protein [Brevibacillus halotolerans]|uniref:WG repeat-containing protein n=1 Tax=Brevibacillus TaxID=55080 RepID=UPI00215C32A8|nr:MULTISPECIES: WG repeat-containing protein [Brevibacillus]MCR8962807.1 WG repeat-containing protein [Brevibacillus laterosporus]MCZ0834962.1 WG repeat-containing protein [Brevibacillus halotolerans]
MVFQPRVEEELHLHNATYTIGEHPVAPHVPYGQEGRQGIVYQMIPRKEADSKWKALKVFRQQYKDPKQVYLSEQIRDFASLPGLSVCDRVILTPQKHGELLSQHRDLMYAVVMPWIEGPTWMDIIIDKRALSRADSLTTARSLAKVLSTMEQQGLAHCDLSGPNLILPGLVRDQVEDGFSYVELVDVEQLYGPRLERPDVLFAASPGYSLPQTSPLGLWSKYADRFSGAILLAEILGWYDETVREAAWGESYFHPEEIPHSTKRYPLLIDSIRNYWGAEIASLLDRAWQSKELNECPTFGEWLLALMDVQEEGQIGFEKQKMADQPPIHISIPQVDMPFSGKETERLPAPEILKTEENAQGDFANLPAIYQKIEHAKQWEAQGELERAIEMYRAVQKQLEPQHALAQDLWMIIAELETKIKTPKPLPEERSPKSAPAKQAERKNSMAKKSLGVGVAAAFFLVAVGGLMWSNEQNKKQTVNAIEITKPPEGEKQDKEAREPLEKEAVEQLKAAKNLQEIAVQEEQLAKQKAERDAKGQAAQGKKEQTNEQQAPKKTTSIKPEKTKKDIQVKEVAQGKTKPAQVSPTKVTLHTQEKDKIQVNQKKSTPKPKHPTLIPRERAGKWGFVELDSTGSANVVVEYQYDYAMPFSEGFAVVKKNGKFGYVNTTGQVVIALTYDWASSFQNGKATVKKDGENVVINPQGIELHTQ